MPGTGGLAIGVDDLGRRTDMGVDREPSNSSFPLNFWNLPLNENGSKLFFLQGVRREVISNWDVVSYLDVPNLVKLHRIESTCQKLGQAGTEEERVPMYVQILMMPVLIGTVHRRMYINIC